MKNEEIISYPSQFPTSRPQPTLEAFPKPSLTEPDNSMSIPEIIARYTRGQGIPVPQHQWTLGAALEEGEHEVDSTEFDFMPGYNAPQKPAEPQEPAESQKPAEPAPAPAGA